MSEEEFIRMYEDMIKNGLIDLDFVIDVLNERAKLEFAEKPSLDELEKRAQLPEEEWIEIPADISIIDIYKRMKCDNNLKDAKLHLDKKIKEIREEKNRKGDENGSED